MKTEDQEETCRYMNMFSNSRIPYHLVNWVISQGEVIRDVDAPLNSTPASFIDSMNVNVNLIKPLKMMMPTKYRRAPLWGQLISHLEVVNRETDKRLRKRGCTVAYLSPHLGSQ
ncbi:unnamed protein product [Brassica napus]|uniref:(rape) hypothetical protein n=1 Tax=Brassica napus TaxID=3708 RepID=A0A816TVQ8_BRANA|nr:unnamed protein product [Brassica napus]